MDFRVKLLPLSMGFSFRLAAAVFLLSYFDAKMEGVQNWEGKKRFHIFSREKNICGYEEEKLSNYPLRSEVKMIF